MKLKKIFATLIAASTICSINLAFAAKDQFFFDPGISIEYSAPRISSAGVNSRFGTHKDIFNQLFDFENVAVGTNIRVHKFLGFNANWAKSDLSSDAIKGQNSINGNAHFNFNQTNISALGYLPVINNFLELFAEAGFAGINSNLSYVDSRGVSVNKKDHELLGLYGVGFQMGSSNTGNAVRVSLQRYTGKFNSLDGNYNNFRIGYIIFF